MQVTPVAARDTAKRYGVAYDWKRLVWDPAYNTQLGAGEISALLQDYRRLIHFDLCRLQRGPRPG